MEENKEISKPLDNLESLTNENWLFIKYILAGNTIHNAYLLAGYTGKSDDAPYVLHHKLRRAIEKIVESEGVDRIRLLLEAKKLLDIPLDPTKTSLTFSEKLRSLKLLRDLVPGADQSAKVNITNFTINRYAEPKEVIEVKALEQ